jgi:hypothetical protein
MDRARDARLDADALASSSGSTVTVTLMDASQPP